MEKGSGWILNWQVFVGKTNFFFLLFTNLQVWMCGGSMEVLPCSRVAHIARTKKPYHNNIAFHTRRNALRVAEVWMDEYKSNVYLAWNIPMEVSERVASVHRPVGLSVH